MDLPDLTERRVQTEDLLQGHFLRVVRDTVALPSGAQSYREYCIHPGAVMIIPLLDETSAANPTVLMERQYRYPVASHLIEFPAGKLDPNEDLLHCAQRELMEETGYRAQYWAHLGCIHPCIAYSTERIDIWLARGLTQGQQSLDADEFLTLLPMSVTALQDHFLRGELTDAKTVSGLTWLEHYLAGRVQVQWLDAAGKVFP
ncbi:NUDIX hydrolase [Curvibacter sp. CHRR-16]|nr:NUDIX hydrolase [Curvibacter sp. CHRR-16]